MLLASPRLSGSPLSATNGDDAASPSLRGRARAETRTTAPPRCRDVLDDTLVGGEGEPQVEAVPHVEPREIGPDAGKLGVAGLGIFNWEIPKFSVAALSGLRVEPCDLARVGRGRFRRPPCRASRNCSPSRLGADHAGGCRRGGDGRSAVASSVTPWTWAMVQDVRPALDLSSGAQTASKSRRGPQHERPVTRRRCPTQAQADEARADAAPTPGDHPGPGLGCAPTTPAPERERPKNNISPVPFRMAKPPPGRFDRVVEKPDHMTPRRADAGIGPPSLEPRQDLLSNAATISAFSCRARERERDAQNTNASSSTGTRRDHDPNSEAA
jgi:hypothetical protein